MLIFLSVLALAGCVTAAVGEQRVIDAQLDAYHTAVTPEQALAKNSRIRERMQKYRYYPDAYIYYSPARHMYFYLSNNRWKSSATLPFSLHSELGDYVNIEAVSDRPYDEFNKHKKLYKSKRRNKKHNPYGKHYGRDKHDENNNN